RLDNFVPSPFENISKDVQFSFESLEHRTKDIIPSPGQRTGKRVPNGFDYLVPNPLDDLANVFEGSPKSFENRLDYVVPVAGNRRAKEVPDRFYYVIPGPLNRGANSLERCSDSGEGRFKDRVPDPQCGGLDPVPDLFPNLPSKLCLGEEQNKGTDKQRDPRHDQPDRVSRYRGVPQPLNTRSNLRCIRVREHDRVVDSHCSAQRFDHQDDREEQRCERCEERHYRRNRRCENRQYSSPRSERLNQSRDNRGEILHNLPKGRHQSLCHLHEAGCCLRDCSSNSLETGSHGLSRNGSNLTEQVYCRTQDSAYIGENLLNPIKRSSDLLRRDIPKLGSKVQEKRVQSCTRTRNGRRSSRRTLRQTERERSQSVPIY